MLRLLLASLLLFTQLTGFACYNEYYSLDSKGQFHQIDVGAIRFRKSFDNGIIQRQLIQLGKKLSSRPDYQLMSDYGLYLVKGGKVTEGLVIFEALAQAYPGEYSIIANLGTTYELAGRNEKALEYIRKGLQLNPGSHGGSEWIHVKILEAKIALEKDPDYLKNHTVLNLTKKQEESEKVRRQLYTQLQERFPFCKGPDPIMADLFEDLGDCYLHSISFEHAKGLYQIARIYYQSTSKALDSKIAEVRKLREKYADRQPDSRGTSDHGEVIKISGVPYTSYLAEPRELEIDWTKIETDPKKLLAGLELEPIEAANTTAQPTQTVPPPRKADVISSEKTPDNSMLWIGLTIAAFIVAIFTYFRTRKK